MNSANVDSTVPKLMAFVIAVIVFAVVFVPIVGSFTDTESTYTNNGVVFASVDSDGTEHIIVVSADADDFVITTDGKVDKLPALSNYNPGGQVIAPALGIGVYEAYVTDDNVMTSQSDRTPTANTTLTQFVGYAQNGNDGNDNGTYRVWNFYDWTMYKLMAFTIMGNMDSQYMLGNGATSGSASSVTGLTSTPYATSSNSSTAMLIENAQGSVWEWIGDTAVNNLVMIAGNSKEGVSSANAVVNTLTTTVTLPNPPSGDSDRWITSIYTESDVFGTPLTLGAQGVAGDAINDGTWDNTSNGRALGVGGDWLDSARAGFSAFDSLYAWSSSYAFIGSRLAYLFDESPMGDGASPSYAYVMSYNEDGTIFDIQVMQNGSLVSVMPTGTTLNSFWDFDTATGIGPFGSYYVAVNLTDGANTDDSTESRLSTKQGAVAYILNPANLKQTLAGNVFDPTLYNVMLVVPTMYWYSDTDTGKLYMASSEDAFDGMTLKAYAHTYTMPAGESASASLVVGSDSIIRIYATGEVRLITNNNSVSLGFVTEDNDVSFSITDDTLTYTPLNGSQTTKSGMIAYISDKGDWSMLLNPVVTEDSEIIIGGYAHSLGTDNDKSVSIGYCASGVFGEFGNSNVTAVLNPVSSDNSTVAATTVEVQSHTVSTDLIKIDKILFESEWSDGGNSTATYTYFLAPSSVAYTNPSYVGGTTGTILVILPIMVALALLLMIANEMGVLAGIKHKFE